MKNNIAHIILLFLVCSIGNNLFSQVDTDFHDVSMTLPEVALLDIEPDNSSIVLYLSPPLEGGDPVIVATGGTDHSKWLNYTSAISPSGTYRTVTAQITSGAVPSGLELSLQALAYSGSGAGHLGTPTGSIVLSNVAQNIITGIGGAYTGNGSFQGHELDYSLTLLNHASLDFDEAATIEITFTITD